MYSSSVIVPSPSWTISAPSFRFASASSLRRLLQVEAVDEDQICAREQLGNARSRLELVRVLALGNDALDVGETARDVGNDVRER